MKATQTNKEFKQVIDECRSLYVAKLGDYGAAWHVLRPASLTDQIFIKAKRIRTIQITGTQLVGEDIRDAFMAIVNYSVMALIQAELGFEDTPLSRQAAIEAYDRHATQTYGLMVKKNHDYGEAWRSMRVSSLTDIILMKLLRVKQIEDANGVTSVSEGVEGNYCDMINYAVFALIKLNEEEGREQEKANLKNTKQHE
ncbi:MAG: DUF1599 domain-containing protein [Bacteroides sp.]|nr:DUF1599 domain-containing protein [Bacteroides sp.]MCM1085799.1 DUF1599 domain-containing protein [Bacteroides sp.]MCM1531371.1 DUF1599 domain-containing protein [Ruminococcus flavefaciens]MCM1554467.1 DUF1599 domain-containing protein [Bacteroides sp.]